MILTAKMEKNKQKKLLSFWWRVRNFTNICFSAVFLVAHLLIRSAYLSLCTLYLGSNTDNKKLDTNVSFSSGGRKVLRKVKAKN